MPATPFSPQSLLKELRAISYDFKASVVAGEVADNGVETDKIAFKSLSIFRRFVSKEIENVKWEHDDSDNDYLLFEVNKEGLYDMLPEAVFHEAKKKDPNQSDDKQIKEQKLQEKAARDFFSPMENEFSRRLLLFDIIDRELNKNSNLAKSRQFFEYFFGKSDQLSDAQVLTLSYILPLSYKIRSNLELIGTTLSRILNAKITVTRKLTKAARSSQQLQSAQLGWGKLGVDTILNNEFVDYSFVYEIQIADVPATDYFSFTDGQKHRNVIDFVSPYFFPANAVVNLVLFARQEDRELKILDTEPQSFLGFNSYI